MRPSCDGFHKEKQKKAANAQVLSPDVSLPKSPCGGDAKPALSAAATLVRDAPFKLWLRSVCIACEDAQFHRPGANPRTDDLSAVNN